MVLPFHFLCERLRLLLQMALRSLVEGLWRDGMGEQLDQTNQPDPSNRRDKEAKK